MALCCLQYLHRMEVAINRGAEGKTGRYFVPNISEERAVELASRFISESFLFSVSMNIDNCCIAWCTALKSRDIRAHIGDTPAPEWQWCCLPQVGVGVIYLEY